MSWGVSIKLLSLCNMATKNWKPVWWRGTWRTCRWRATSAATQLSAGDGRLSDDTWWSPVSARSHPLVTCCYTQRPVDQILTKKSRTGHTKIGGISQTLTPVLKICWYCLPLCIGTLLAAQKYINFHAKKLIFAHIFHLWGWYPWLLRSFTPDFTGKRPKITSDLDLWPWPRSVASYGHHPYTHKNQGRSQLIQHVHDRLHYLHH